MLTIFKYITFNYLVAFANFSIFENKISHAGLEVLKCFSCSTQLNMKFILLISVKMPTIVNTVSESLKARCLHFLTF